MARKYKLTWFARFSLFMLFITPFCYFGVTHYQNNPEVKDMVDNVIEKIESQSKTLTNSEEAELNVKELKEDIELLKDEIKEIEELIENKEIAIENLEDQLEV